MPSKPSAMRNRFIVREISTFAVVSEKYLGFIDTLERSIQKVLHKPLPTPAVGNGRACADNGSDRKERSEEHFVPGQMALEIEVFPLHVTMLTIFYDEKISITDQRFDFSRAQFFFADAAVVRANRGDRLQPPA